jgi:hypothetical protein
LVVVAFCGGGGFGLGGDEQAGRGRDLFFIYLVYISRIKGTEIDVFILISKELMLEFIDF